MSRRRGRHIQVRQQHTRVEIHRTEVLVSTPAEPRLQALRAWCAQQKWSRAQKIARDIGQQHRGNGARAYGILSRAALAKGNMTWGEAAAREQSRLLNGGGEPGFWEKFSRPFGWSS